MDKTTRESLRNPNVRESHSLESNGLVTASISSRSRSISLEALLSIALVLTEAPEAVRGLVASTGARSTEASWSIGVDWTGFLIGGGGTFTIEWQSGHRICLPTCNAWTDRIDLQTWQVIEYSRSAGLLAAGLLAGGLVAGGSCVFGALEDGALEDGALEDG